MSQTTFKDIIETSNITKNNGERYRIKMEHSAKLGYEQFVKALRGNLYYCHIRKLNKYKNNPNYIFKIDRTLFSKPKKRKLY